MRWVKQGVVLEPPRGLEWARSHAALPIPEPLGDGRVAVLFSARDDEGRARIGYSEVVLNGEAETLVRPDPVLDLGELGRFDDSGVTTSCLVKHDGRRYLYYSGWSRGVSVPFYLFAGCAVSDGGPFVRVSPAPILERNDVDPYLTASPWVIVDADGRWRMWYVSGTGWQLEDGRPRHRYHIKYAESYDGVTWRRNGHVCIDYLDDSEYAIARPCVLRDGDCYRMWFCARGDSYRLGYAESTDGLTWSRHDDDVQLEGDGRDWDAEMQAYPAVFDNNGRRHMLYNGNDYGRTGIGHAVLEAE
jgi:hypothetical protein